MNHWKSIVIKWPNEDLSIRREKLSQLKNRWYVVIKDGAFKTIEIIFDNSVLSSRSCQLLNSIISYVMFFDCDPLAALFKEEEIVVFEITGCQTIIILDHNALGTKCFAMYIALISLSFVYVELFLVNTETPLKSRNQCQCFKGPTLLNLPLQGSILIPLFFYYVALPFMLKQLCEIKSVDKILWYIM